MALVLANVMIQILGTEVITTGEADVASAEEK
jgi:hypothetical protein